MTIAAEPADEAEHSSSSRPRRARHSTFGTYNVKVLSGTAIHAPRKFRKDIETDDEITTRRRTISGDTLIGSLSRGINASTETVTKEANRLVRDGIDALDLQWSVKKLPKSRSQLSLGQPSSPKKGLKGLNLDKTRTTRSAGAPVIESLTKKLSVLGKRGRNAFEASLAKGKREIKRLADTNEFAKVEVKPVVHEVWSRGKLVPAGETAPPPRKKAKIELPTEVKEEEVKSPEKEKPKQRVPKIWSDKGLYAGQEVRKLNWFAGLSDVQKSKMSDLPDFKPNGALPLPMWHGQRLLHDGRDFKLPFDVCSPLPPGQPKPDEWRKMPKSK
jgi:histone-lysine N-methyltransferase ASH1L